MLIRLYHSRYTTKWPYFTNLSFLETVVSVRGSTSQNNSAIGDYTETSEYTVVSCARYSHVEGSFVSFVDFIYNKLGGVCTSWVRWARAEG